MASKGWTQGNGLGRSLQGRKDPVKVKFKFDINGLGHDRAEEDKYKWWEYAFKTAADSIQVGKGTQSTNLQLFIFMKNNFYHKGHDFEIYDKNSSYFLNLDGLRLQLYRS